MADQQATSQDFESSKGRMKKAVQYDETYYIQSAYVVFQVENRLFRLPSYLFARESEFFQGMFLLPQGEALGTGAEMSSTAGAIILPEEYRSDDFKSLVKALYPRIPYVQWTLSTSEWLSVLKLATKWYFLRLREIAIKEVERLHELTSVQKVKFGRKYSIYSWVLEGLKELANRDATIEDHEAIELDSDNITTAYRLYRAREGKIRERRQPARVVTSIWGEDVDAPPVPEYSEIEEVFKDELDSIRAEQEGYSAA